MGKWQKISSEIVHANDYFSVSQDAVVTPTGSPGTYFVIHHRPSVSVVVLTDDNKILLEKQFRYPTQMDSWEIVAGGAEPNEHPLEAAKRELAEELGYTADHWEHLGKLQCAPGSLSVVQDVYLCHGLHKTAQNDQSSEGITATQAFTIDEIFSMIARGDLTDAASTMAPLLLALSQNKIPQAKEQPAVTKPSYSKSIHQVQNLWS